MAKLTQKEKLKEAFIFAQSIRHSAANLEYFSNSYDFTSGRNIAKDLQAKVEEFIKKLQ